MNNERTEKVNTYLELRKKHGNGARVFIYRRAIAKYGRASRLNLAIEEMSELTKELCKRNRGESRLDDIAEEMADVEIMLEQLKLLFDNAALVNTFKNAKLCRLADLIEQDNAQG